MMFWLGVIIGWLTATPLVLFSLALARVSRHD
jgi:hypothetical protein